MISELKFPSAKRGIAAGYILKNDKPQPHRPGHFGRRRSLDPHTREGKSLTACFSLTIPSAGWSPKRDFGRRTRRAAPGRKLAPIPREITRVHFLDRKHGWAIGNKMSALETKDGGATWHPLAALDELKVAPEFTTFNAIAFASPDYGIIAGADVPPPPQ